MTSRPVVIISPARDAHAIAVRDRLAASGVPVRLFDPGKFPERMHITLREQLEHVEIDGELVTPSSVYVRDLALAGFVMAIVHRWEAAGIPIYNPLSALPRTAKPYQLALLAAAQLPVPRTRWTNDPAEVRDFAGRERLDLLRESPVCCQDHLTGDELRVYVIDDEIVASIRDDEHHPLADPVRRVCRRAAEVLGLRFSGIDLKADASGTLHILELDPVPMFLGFDARAGTDVLGALCAALARRANVWNDERPTARAHRRSSKQ